MLRLEDLFMIYGDEQYAELGVFVDLLRSLSFLHQTHHWQTKGQSSYSDHLLFQRLYETASGQVDGVAEKAVGMASASLVAYRNSLTNMPRFLTAIEDIDMIGDFSPALKMAKKSLVAEKSFVTAGEKLMNMLKSKGLLTRGVEQLLGTILDEHETLIYLLKQRVASGV